MPAIGQVFVDPFPFPFPFSRHVCACARSPLRARGGCRATRSPGGNYDVVTTLGARAQLTNLVSYRLDVENPAVTNIRVGLLAWYPPIALGPRCPILPV
jgi:hypothetical protein